jgi:hypothetical protein
MHLLKLILAHLDFSKVERDRLRAVLLDLVDVLTAGAMNPDRLRVTFLEFLDLLAESTDTPLDDLLVERLKAAGADDEVIDQFLKPDRIQ